MSDLCSTNVSPRGTTAGHFFLYMSYNTRMFFGKKKPDSETVLLLDVESGSVGSGLAILSPHEAPKLFGEVRIELPRAYHAGSSTLIPQVEKAIREALAHASSVAARLRSNDNVSRLGSISRGAVFLSAPWGSPNLSAGAKVFHGPLHASLQDEIAGYLGVGAQYYTGADVATFGAKRLVPGQPVLVCVVRGETTELILLGTDGVQGYATLPTGLHTVIRTLKSHGGMSDAEAFSMFSLAGHPRAVPHEPLEASAQHFVEEFAGAAQHLLNAGEVSGVYVVAHDSAGDWFARALSQDESLSEYFPSGGTVRAMRTHHLRPHVSAHLASPDLYLMLEALFVDGSVPGVRKY